MIRAMKSYWAFTNRIYRLLVLLVIPIVYCLVCGVCILGGIADGVGISLGLYLVLYTVEAMSDYWLLGGFYAKNNSSLEFLQSSNRFRMMIRDVVIIDIIRRVLFYVGLYLIAILMAVLAKAEMGFFVLFGVMPLLQAVLAQIAVFIGRHFVLWNQAYIPVGIGMMVNVTIFIVILFVVEKYWIPIQVGLAVLMVLVSVITVRYSMKKVRDSYYDQ